MMLFRKLHISSIYEQGGNRCPPRLTKDLYDLTNNRNLSPNARAIIDMPTIFDDYTELAIKIEVLESAESIYS
jgi:hypothetical protein